MPDFLKMLRRPAREAKVSRAAPLIALAGVGRPIWSSRDTSDLMREGYAKNAVVFRCVRLVAEAAAAIPAYVFRDRDELRNHPLELLLSRPNPRQGGRDLMEQVFTNMLLTGNAYVEMVAEAGVPRELYSLRPDRVKIVPGPDGWPEAYEYTAGGQTIALRCDGEGIPPVLHLKFADPLDDHYGLAPLSAAQVPLDIHNSASAWNKALLDNSARPSGALVYAQGGANMTDEQFARLKEELEGAFSGPLNAGRPMLLEGGLDWKPLALSPRDMDFMAAKSAAAREIALAFGVPPLLLGLPGDNTHANYAEANRALWRQTVIPLARRVTEALAHWLSPGFGGGLRLDLDLDHIEALAEEREAKMKAMLRADYLTVNEKREAIGYGKRPDGDRLVSSRGQVIDLEAPPPASKAALAALLRKFDVNQPRVLAGSSDGGQWTDGGGGSGDVGGQLGDAVIQTISDTLSQLVFDPIDLKLEEGGLHGGHTISSHVGKSDDELKSALYSSRFDYWVGNLRHTIQKEAVGSFDSIESANDFVNRALEANPEFLELLLEKPRGHRDILEHRFGFRTGKEAWSINNDSDAEIRWTFAIRILLQRDNISDRGFRIVTAFPANQRKR